MTRRPDPWGPTAGPRPPASAGLMGISPTFIGAYAGYPVVRDRDVPVGRITMLAEPLTGPDVNLFAPATWASVEAESVPTWELLGRPDLAPDPEAARRRRPYAKALIVGDADRYPDPWVERVYRLAVADAVETVRAGLARFVERDPDIERLADLFRPTAPRTYVV